MKQTTTALAAALAALATSPALAAPETDVPSALEAGDPFDLHASLGYRFTSRRSAIKRELSGFPGTDPEGSTPIVKDLRFSLSRHEIVPRLEVGIFQDLWLSGELPIVLRSRGTLEFDQSTDPCVFADDGAPTCINAENSTTVQDGLLPPTGFDADDPAGPGFGGDASTIFRGPARAGLDQVHLGVGFAPMNQARDESKPTWKVGAELRFAIGKTVHLNRSAPGDDQGVSRGLHELELWTSMAKRIDWVVPYVHIWYRAPIGTTDDSPFRDLQRPFGATSRRAQKIAGSRFGLEAIAWERPEEKQRIGLRLDADLQAHFEGRGLSDMWEVFQYAGAASQPDAPLRIDLDPTEGGLQALDHPGASNIENYLTMAGTIGIDAALGERIRLSASLSGLIEQSHLISFADAGIDSPRCAEGESTDCETNDNEVVDAGTAEVNPLHVRLIDLVGHRYRVDEARELIVSFSARVLF